MDKVTPTSIISPYTGGLIKPRIKTREYRGKIYTEAHWICPNSGQFIRKGIVKVEDVNKKDGTSSHI
jgi:hypothetical protein